MYHAPCHSSHTLLLLSQFLIDILLSLKGEDSYRASLVLRSLFGGFLPQPPYFSGGERRGYPPTVSVSSLVNSLKGASSYVLSASCGGAPLDVQSNAASSSKRQRHSRGLPRPQFRGLRHSLVTPNTRDRAAAGVPVFDPWT